MSRDWGPRDTAYFLPLLIERDGKSCYYCRKIVYLSSEIEGNPLSTRERQLRAARRPLKATVDHKIPVANGGEEFDIDNMVIACITCNKRKGLRDPGAFIRNKKRHDRK